MIMGIKEKILELLESAGERELRFIYIVLKNMIQNHAED